MKKLFIILFLLVPAIAFPQLDSLQANQLIHIGIDIANGLNKTIIPFLPNEVTGSILTGLAALVLRFFEKRKMKRKLAAAEQLKG